MTEWHTTPDYIVNNWTDELLNLMVEKLAERKHRELDAAKPTSSQDEDKGVSVQTLAARSRGMIKVEKKE